jgi:hypothetical protein
MQPTLAVHGLTLNGSCLDETRLAESIRRHPSLQKLTILFCSTLTDAGVAHLTQLSLRKLVLTECSGLTKAALSTIARIESLESLTLVCNQFSGEELTVFTSLKQLRELDISGWPILEGENYRYLAPFIALKRLAIGRRSDSQCLWPTTAVKIAKQLNLERLDITAPRECPYNISDWSMKIALGLKAEQLSVEFTVT